MSQDSRPYLVPAGHAVHGRVVPPPSKSFTHRYCNLALLANEPVVLHRPLEAEDSALFFGVLEALGWKVDRRADRARLEPAGRSRDAELYCGNAGTLFRFLVATLTTRLGRFRVDGSPRLRERPIGPLVEALEALGAEIRYLEQPGHAPLEIQGGTLHGGKVRLDAGESSQYLSAVLMAALAAREEVTLELKALTSAPYVDLTLAALARFGGRVRRPAPGLFEIDPGLEAPAEVTVEGDYSAAAYPAAAAILSGGEVELSGLDPDSAQGDRGLLELFARMGAEVERREDGWRVAAGRPLVALDADLSAMPDQVPTLAAVALFAQGETRITGVPHLRIKESDRLAAVATELNRLGARVVELPDGLIVPGDWATTAPPSAPTRVETHNDHRIAMSLALVGLRRPGVAIAAPEVVAKSYPGFWLDFERLLAVG